MTQPHVTRRRFLEGTAGALGLAASGATVPLRVEPPAASLTVKEPIGFDPWIEIDRGAFQHNVREAARLAGGRPIMAVVKNNAYGLGDRVVGPILDQCPEVGAIACVRTVEAVAMREAGVKKPILNMAEVSELEMLELARRRVACSVWLDDAPERLDRVARRLKRPVPIHLYLDTGMGREGMPYYRARPWIEALTGRQSAQVLGTYMMFAHDVEFDREQLTRFTALVNDARDSGLALGTLHAAPTFELFLLPDAHLDMVRPGNALFGNYPNADGVRELANLATVFRLRARVARLEQLRPGDSASFYRSYVADRPVWIALLPVGHTDGYPATAANTCHVLIRDRLYPVISVVSSTHTIVEIGDEKTVEIGDTATLIGPDEPAIAPHAVAEQTGVRFFVLITKLNARLPRHIV